MESIPSFLPSKSFAAVVHAEVHLQKREETHRHRNRLESPKTKLDEAQNKARRSPKRSPTKPKTKLDEAQNLSNRYLSKACSVKYIEWQGGGVARWRGGRVAE